MNSNNFSTDNKFMEKIYKKPLYGDKLNHLIKLSQENDITIIYKSNIKSVEKILKDCNKQKRKLIKQSALDLNELSKTTDDISIDVIKTLHNDLETKIYKLDELIIYTKELEKEINSEFKGIDKKSESISQNIPKVIRLVPLKKPTINIDTMSHSNLLELNLNINDIIKNKDSSTINSSEEYMEIYGN